MADYDPTKENEEDALLAALLDQDDDDDDNEETNTTQPIQPGAASTPYQPQDPYHDGEAHEMSNFNLNEEFNPDDIPVLVDYIDEDEKEKFIE